MRFGKMKRCHSINYLLKNNIFLTDDWVQVRMHVHPLSIFKLQHLNHAMKFCTKMCWLHAEIFENKIQLLQLDYCTSPVWPKIMNLNITGFNSVVPPVLFIAVSNIEQCCWAWIAHNNVFQPVLNNIPANWWFFALFFDFLICKTIKFVTPQCVLSAYEITCFEVYFRN